MGDKKAQRKFQDSFWTPSNSKDWNWHINEFGGSPNESAHEAERERQKRYDATQRRIDKYRGGLLGYLNENAEQNYQNQNNARAGLWSLASWGADYLIPSSPEGLVVEGVSSLFGGKAAKGATDILKSTFKPILDKLGNLKILKKGSKKPKAPTDTPEPNSTSVTKEKGGDANKQAQKTNGDNNPDSKVGDPVNTITGETSLDHTDFTLHWRIPVTWTRVYGSHCDYAGRSGNGWQSPSDTRLEVASNGIVLFCNPTGKTAVFESLPEDRPVMEVSDGAVLNKTQDALTVTTKHGLIYHFPKPDRTFDRIYLDKITDRCGNSLCYSRENGRLARISDSSGHAVEVESKHGRITALNLVTANQNKVLARYDYDLEGNLVAAMDALGAPHSYRYKNGLLIKHTDRNGYSFQYQYDSYTKTGRCIRTTGDDGFYDYTLNYMDGKTLVTDSLGQEKVMHYDKDKLLTGITQPDGTTIGYEHDDTGRTIAVRDPAGNQTEYDYDRSGNLTSVIRPDKACIIMEYDAAQNSVGIVDPNGNVWRQQWDAQGLLEKSVSPTGAETLYFYNEKGDLISLQDPEGARVHIERDDRGTVSAITDPLGHITTYKTDDLGNVVSMTDPEGRRTQYGYDDKSRLIWIRRPSGQTASVQYDAEDNPVQYTDAAGRITLLEYTGTGEVSKRKDPDGSTVTYAYDTEDRLVGLTNQRGERYGFKLDKMGRVVEETDYWGATRQFSYDPAGRLARLTDPLGQITKFEFDPLGRLKEKIFSDDTREKFEYDRNGNLTAHENMHGHSQNQYDPENRLVQEDRGDFQIFNTYDARGYRIARSTSHGNDVHYGFDAAGGLETITINNSPALEVKRNKTGRTVHELLGGNIRREYRYDSKDLLASQTIRAETLDITRNYAYDSAGNLIEKTDSIAGQFYFTYDPADRIISSINPERVMEKFNYDPAGDLLKKTSSNDDTQDQRTQRYKNSTYSYDRAGRLISRKDPNGTMDLEWDPSDRLIKATSKNGTSTQMGYDALGRRLIKSTNGVKTRFSWDGDQLLSDNSGDGAREFVYYPGTFEPLALIDTNQQVYYYHNDLAGLPQQVSDTEGNIVWSATYDALGRVDKTLVDEVHQPLRLQGQYYDPETELCYNRYRHFDPQTCSFISQDPIGLAAGENVYAYGPNVLNWIDPLGLCKEASKSEDIQFAGGRSPWTEDLSHVTGNASQARNKAIDAAIKEDLPNLKLTHKPQYSPFASQGVAKKATGTQIGKNSFGSRSELRDTIVHEELHHRWWNRGVNSPHHSPDKYVPNEKFYEVLKRYKRMRGWD